MVDLLVLLTVCFVDGMRKLFIVTCKGSWLFIKIIVCVGFIPLIDAAMLVLALVAFIVCKIFKHSTPKLVHTKYWMVYPSWQ